MSGQQNYGAAAAAPTGNDQSANAPYDVSLKGYIVIQERMDEEVRSDFAKKVLGWMGAMLCWSAFMVFGIKL